MARCIMKFQGKSVAKISAPVFASQVPENLFHATYFLHQLMGEEQYAWLQDFTQYCLSDPEAKALVLAKETGAIDNAGLRAITNLDTLGASAVLRKLCEHKLLTKGGAGPSTFYRLAEKGLSGRAANDESQSTAEVKPGDLRAKPGDLSAKPGDLRAKPSDLPIKQSELPRALLERVEALGKSPRRDKYWPVLVWLCALRPLKAEQLARFLGKQTENLKTSHLNRLRVDEGYIDYLYPEVTNHPDQAYKATAKGLAWLEGAGCDLNE